MPARKRSTATAAKRAVDIPKSTREPSKARRSTAEKAQTRAKPAAKRATRPPREKTFRIPELEDPPAPAAPTPAPAVQAPTTMSVHVPLAPLHDGAWLRARDALHLAHDGLGRSLTGELDRVEAALASQLRAMSARLEETRHEVERLRRETETLRETPLDIVFADLRAQIDAVHSPGAS